MQKNNKITFLISSLNAGGAEKVALLVMNELVRRNWEVTFLLTKLEGPYLQFLDSRVKIIVLSNKKISKNIFSIAKYLKKNSPDVFYSSMMYINIIAGISAKLANYRGKLVFSEHSHPSAVLETQGNVIVKFIFLIAKYIYPFAKSIICVSDGIKDDLNKMFKRLPDLFVVNNPVEIKEYNQPELDSNIFKIVSVGRLHKDKNFELLIRTFSLLINNNQQTNIHLFILGEGNHRKNIELLITELNLENKVTLMGFVDSPTEFVNNCDLFVFPSNREGFGNVLVEALSTGIPIISADCPSGPAEILDYGNYGALFPINDSESLYTQIQNELNNSTRLDPNLVNKRKVRALDFKVETIVNKYVEVFEN